MKKNKFSFPLEYSTLHQYFDALNPGTDDEKNSWIASVLKQHNIVTVLDMTCGTGSQVFWLIGQGYKVTGSDLSKQLLAVAKKKALDKKVKVRFLHGDMRDIQIGKFDAVITIANAIGHVTKAGFTKTVKNVASNLQDGGIYIFDIFNLQAMTDSVVANLAMNYKRTIKDIQIHHVQCSTINRAYGILTSYDYFILQKNVAQPKLITNKFSLQLYRKQEIEKILKQMGFKIITICGANGVPFNPITTENMFVVARKK